MESSKNSLDNSCSILCCISAFFAGEAFRHFSAVSSNLYFNTFHSIIICDMYKDTKKKTPKLLPQFHDHSRKFQVSKIYTPLVYKLDISNNFTISLKSQYVEY